MKRARARGGEPRLGTRLKGNAPEEGAAKRSAPDRRGP